MENGWKGDAYHVQDTVTLEMHLLFFSKESFELSWKSKKSRQQGLHRNTFLYFSTTYFYQFQKKTFYQKKKQKNYMALFFSRVPTDTPHSLEDSQGQQKIQNSVNPKMCNAYWEHSVGIRQKKKA